MLELTIAAVSGIELCVFLQDGEHALVVLRARAQLQGPDVAPVRHVVVDCVVDDGIIRGVVMPARTLPLEELPYARVYRPCVTLGGDEACGVLEYVEKLLAVLLPKHPQDQILVDVVKEGDEHQELLHPGAKAPPELRIEVAHHLFEEASLPGVAIAAQHVGDGERYRHVIARRYVGDSLDELGRGRKAVRGEEVRDVRVRKVQVL